MILLNGNPVNTTIFPDNTSQVWKLPQSTFEDKKAYVSWSFSHEGEIMHLAQLQDLLLSRGIETTLYIKYLPYARQDKSVSNDATFALNTFLKIIRSLNFAKLIVLDPHNFDAVRPGCMVEALYPVKKVEEIVQMIGQDVVLCYPDKGAVTKYAKVYESLNKSHIYGDKVRDQLTGNILSYKVVGGCAGKNVLIIDDICDGGMTFKILAKHLLDSGASSVVLFVTHGIFSKGVRTLMDSGITRVFTADGEVTARFNSSNV